LGEKQKTKMKIKVKNWFKKKKNQFMKSKFLVFTLGIIIGSTSVYIYITAPIVFEPITKTIKISNRASAEEVTSEIVGGADNTSPLVKTSLNTHNGIEGLVARYFGADTDKVMNLVQCESSWNPACGELDNPACINPKNNSYDRGYFQISRKYHPEVSDKCAFDLECSAKWASQRIKAGHLHEWACWKAYK